jgi:hypothetical protein
MFFQSLICLQAKFSQSIFVDVAIYTYIISHRSSLNNTRLIF